MGGDVIAEIILIRQTAVLPGSSRLRCHPGRYRISHKHLLVSPSTICEARRRVSISTRMPSKCSNTMALYRKNFTTAAKPNELVMKRLLLFSRSVWVPLMWLSITMSSALEVRHALSSSAMDVNHRNPVFYPHVDIDSSGVGKKMEEVFGEEEAKRAM
jgi:hypothetical protein